MRDTVKRGSWLFLLLALMIAAFLSPWASSYPDGLERVAEDQGFLERSEGKEVIKGLMPDYIFPGIENEKLATALAGIIGTSLTFGAAWGIGRLWSGHRGQGYQKQSSA
ncbi:cobalt/nickel transport protein [Thermanaeromonas toyohensis ToBE]|uniref:Cobalt/nickel transport protein n=1 Tax=Thermanaeromonas toyohensis ToBE TaxID=698762 RepID=A0A1W1W075_9FIRM|nr:PDGLE domain-containing protein [Thermanaeromonas toyohensis]SMB98900.1 cobalt/nickel transport protein [Thermanaeromonas toyohensis ToBE]